MCKKIGTFYFYKAMKAKLFRIYKKCNKKNKNVPIGKADSDCTIFQIEIKKCSPLDPYNMYKYNLVNKLQGLAHSLRNNLGPADLGSLGIWLFVVELVLEKEPGSIR